MSNCLLAAISIYRRFGGAFIILNHPSTRNIPWSLIPHIGVEIKPNIALHYKALNKDEPCPLWFRGKLKRDYIGP